MNNELEELKESAPTPPITVTELAGAFQTIKQFAEQSEGKTIAELPEIGGGFFLFYDGKIDGVNVESFVYSHIASDILNHSMISMAVENHPAIVAQVAVERAQHLQAQQQPLIVVPGVNQSPQNGNHLV